MKAVILAAGKGSRMMPLTENTPKPLLPVKDKPIINHNIELVEDHVDEIIVVGGFEIEQIEEEFSDRDDVKVIEQEEALGTANAALQAKEHVDGKTVVMNGDDIYGEKAVEALKKDYAVLSSRVDDPEKFGVFQLDDGKIGGLVEKPDNPSSDLVNIGFYVVQEDFFDLLDDVEISERGEYEITDAVNNYLKNHEVDFVEADRWLPCSYPFQLVEASLELTDGVEVSEDAELSEEAELSGDVFIGSDVRVEAGVEISDSVLLEACTVKSDVSNSVALSGSKVSAEVENAVVRKGSSVDKESKNDDIEIVGGKE